MGHLHRLTPSSLDQAAGCIRSADLEDRVDPQTPWATEGSSGHEVATALLAGKPCPPGLEVDIDALREALGGGAFSAEVGVIWQPSTGAAHILGEGLTREQAHRLAEERVKTLDGGWMVGLADLVGVVEHEGRKVVVVADLKFGHKRPPVADDCRQTKAYAAGVCAALGAEEAVHGCIWMPGGKGGTWHPPMKGHMDGIELMAFGVEVAALLAEVERVQALPLNDRPPVRPGDNTCAYCKQATACPAITGHLARFGELARRGDGKLEVTRENAATVLERVQAIEGLCRDAKKTLGVLAAQAPIPIADGQLWGPHPVTAETILPLALPAALAALGLTDAQMAAVMEAGAKVIKGATMDALKGELNPKRGTWAGIERAFLASLREAGGIKKTEKIEVGAYSPKET